MTQKQRDVDELAEDTRPHLHESTDDWHAVVDKMLWMIISKVHELESSAHVRRQLQVQSDRAYKPRQIHTEPVVALPYSLLVPHLEYLEPQNRILNNEHEEQVLNVAR